MSKRNQSIYNEMVYISISITSPLATINSDCLNKRISSFYMFYIYLGWWVDQYISFSTLSAKSWNCSLEKVFVINIFLMVERVANVQNGWHKHFSLWIFMLLTFSIKMILNLRWGYFRLGFVYPLQHIQDRHKCYYYWNQLGLPFRQYWFYMCGNFDNEHQGRQGKNKSHDWHFQCSNGDMCLSEVRSL